MKLLKSGNVFRVGPELTVADTLEKGVYLIQQDLKGFFLVKKPDLTLPPKIYGDHSVVDRWLKSFNENSQKNMGVLLNGLKGTGKTITAQLLCVKSELPIIIIDQPYTGPEFIDFITSPLFGKCVIFIDEFEKVYRERDDSSKQEGLLQLMDGAYQTRFLFLLTSNEARINQYLTNRLGRIKYRQNYNELPKDIMLSVIDDMLVRPHHRDSIINFFENFDMCTYDILVNMIKEVNLFDEDAFTCAKYLNLEPEEKNYSIKAIYKGVEYYCYSSGFSPLKTQTFRINVSDSKLDDLINKERRKINKILNGQAQEKHKALLYEEKVSSEQLAKAIFDEDLEEDFDEDYEDDEKYGYTGAQIAALLANGIDVKKIPASRYEVDLSETPLVKTEEGNYLLELPERGIKFTFSPYKYRSYFG